MKKKVLESEKVKNSEIEIKGEEERASVSGKPRRIEERRGERVRPESRIINLR